jgi:hypothetical protein
MRSFLPLRAILFQRGIIVALFVFATRSTTVTAFSTRPLLSLTAAKTRVFPRSKPSRRHSSSHQVMRRAAASSSNSDSTTMTFMEALSKAASEALGRTVVLSPSGGGGASGGGGGASTSTVTDGTNTYFCKAASDRDMLYAEYTAVRALADTHTIKVPTPIAYGEYQNRAFVLFEYLQFCPGGSQYKLGRQLAALHQHTSPNGKFGFDIDNTIGATFQPNGYMDTWEDFWDEHRLGHMLRLTNDAGYTADKIQALRSKTRELLSHQPQGTLGRECTTFPALCNSPGRAYTLTQSFVATRRLVGWQQGFLQGRTRQ